MIFNKRTLKLYVTRPLANISFTVMRKQVSAIEKSGITMMHTARPFWYYRKVFFQGRSATAVLQDLTGKTVVDIGCGYTPFADDSMFQACHKAGIDFYGVDPLLAKTVDIARQRE